MSDNRAMSYAEKLSKMIQVGSGRGIPPLPNHRYERTGSLSEQGKPAHPL